MIKVTLFLLGRVFSEKGSEEYVVKTIIPELPVQKNIYFCDKRFRIEFLEQYMNKPEEILVIMAFGEETTYYKLCGEHYIKIKNITVHRQKSQKKGGQSAPRFQRIRLNQINDYINKIHAELFEIQKNNNFKKIIVVGNAEIKDSIEDKNIIAKITTNSDNVNDNIQKIKEILNTTSYKENNSVIDDLINKIMLLDEKIIYGKNDIIENIDLIKELYISPDYEEEFKNYNVKMNIINHYKLKMYGGVIGIRYY
jgi:peptide chain release factor subunit 1